jgi:hypothetical protein
MIIARPVLIALVCLSLLSKSAISQTSHLGENCDLSALGAKENKTFLDFDREFRYALSNQNAGVMALLVEPSLRINDDRGTFYIEDARSLQLRFQEIFTSGVRDTVLKQRPEGLSCSGNGIMYGDGVVWANYTGRRYAIKSVNVPSSPPAPKFSERIVEFACNADKHRVIVDAVVGGAPRYRSWTKPHSLTEKPDLELGGGKRESEGSGVCAYEIWKFSSGGTEFDVEGPQACYEESHPPPANSTGMLEVSVPGKPVVSWWCR